MKTLKHIYLLFLLVTISKANAQDFTFSQFYEMPLLRNPAIAGLFGTVDNVQDMRIQSAYRNQWASVSSPFRTIALSAEFKRQIGKSDDWITYSFQTYKDEAGDANLGTVSILPAINIMKSVGIENESYLSFAFMGGLVQNRFDPSKMTFDDQFQDGAFFPENPTNQTFNATTNTYFDASTGLSYSSNIGYDTRYYLGAALFHLNKPKNQFAAFGNEKNINPRFSLNGGLTSPTNDNNRFNIFADYIIQGGNKQFLLGYMYIHQLAEATWLGFETSLSLGGFIRWGDAFVPVAKLDYKRLSLGVSYDVNMSKLITASKLKGGFEITTSFKTQLNFSNQDFQNLRCPRF